MKLYTGQCSFEATQCNSNKITDFQALVFHVLINFEKLNYLANMRL
jgi:hypothetical protein